MKTMTKKEIGTADIPLICPLPADFSMTENPTATFALISSRKPKTESLQFITEWKNLSLKDMNTTGSFSLKRWVKEVIL